MKKNQKLPDAFLHQRISFIKSAIRLAGYFLLLFSVPVAVGILILSEIIGIIEELVWKQYYILVLLGVGLVKH